MFLCALGRHRVRSGLHYLSANMHGPAVDGTARERTGVDLWCCSDPTGSGRLVRVSIHGPVHVFVPVCAVLRHHAGAVRTCAHTRVNSGAGNTVIFMETERWQQASESSEAW